MKTYLDEYQNRKSYFSDYLYYQRYFNNSQGKILEIGCSVGHLMSYLSDRKIGIDIDIEALQITKRKGMNVVCQNIDSGLCFKNNNFIAIDCQNVIEHIKDPVLFIRECYRVLKKDGSLIVTTIDIKKLKFEFYVDYTHIRPFTKISLRNLARDAGFSKVEVLNIPRGIPFLKFLFNKKIIDLKMALNIQDILYSIGWRLNKNIILVATK